MAGTFTTQGFQRVFNDFLTAEWIVCHLFTNPTDPGMDSPTFTETTAAGYSPQGLTTANWTNMDGGTDWAYNYPTPIVFTFSASATIYGYWACIGYAGVPLWYEFFSGGAIILGGSGGTITIDPISVIVSS